MRRIVSQSQFALLLDLLDHDRDLATGRLSVVDQAIKWAGIADSLNGLGDGATKSGSEWKTYWHEQKCKAKRRAKEVRQRNLGKAEGSLGKKPLTEIERRILGLLVQSAVYINEENIINCLEPLEAPVQWSPKCPARVKRPAAAPARSLPPGAKVLCTCGPGRSSVGNAYTAPAQPVAPPQAAPPALQRRRRRGVLLRRQYLKRREALPQWALDFERRRLEVDKQAAQALQAIAEAINKLNDNVLLLLNK